MNDLIYDSNELVFVSNRKNVIAHLFPLFSHGCYMWHMEKKLIQWYNSESSIFLFKWATKVYHIEEFEWLMRLIRIEIARSFGYLKRTGFAYWSRALLIGHGYNIMTNDNAELLISMLKHALRLLIICLIKNILITMQKWFFEHCINTTTCSTDFEDGKKVIHNIRS